MPPKLQAFVLEHGNFGTVMPLVDPNGVTACRSVADSAVAVPQ